MSFYKLSDSEINQVSGGEKTRIITCYYGDSQESLDKLEPVGSSDGCPLLRSEISKYGNMKVIREKQSKYDIEVKIEEKEL